MTSYQTLLVESQDDILIVTINRPKALNALNDQVFKDLIQLFTKDIDASTIKGVVITGAGEKAFVAGADIKEFLQLDNASASALSKRGHDIYRVIETFSKPVIAAVNGFALGGGCELAMACHMRIAGEHARFGQPEVNLGIVPGYAGSQRLPQLIGRGRALELLMTGDMIDATEAHRVGLVNAVVSSGTEVEAAVKVIQKIVKKAPLAIAEVIQLVDDHYNKNVDGGAAEVAAFGRMADTADFKEGAAAFIEKRKPNWQAK